jgi:RimJ/RimL family protein N-acetyltransferase
MDRDPLVTRFIDGPWSDPVAHRAFVEDRMRHAYPAGMGYWSILAPAFIGWILLTPLDLLGPEVEIGWRLVRSAWGQGYATEAAQPILNHALQVLHLPRVIADIDPANAASASVACKLGFVPEGTVPYAGRVVTRYVATAA